MKKSQSQVDSSCLNACLAQCFNRFFVKVLVRSFNKVGTPYAYFEHFREILLTPLLIASHPQPSHPAGQWAGAGQTSYCRRRQSMTGDQRTIAEIHAKNGQTLQHQCSYDAQCTDASQPIVNNINNNSVLKIIYLDGVQQLDSLATAKVELQLFSILE